MEHIEELLLVRGVTPDVFYGTPDHPGLRDFLDVGGESAKLDINSAPPMTFHIAPSLTPEELDAIVALRRKNPKISQEQFIEITKLI